VWLRGRAPDGPFVWAANHHSWWDPFIASAVLARSGHPACLLMRQDNLSRYGFARRLGVFGSAEPRTGLRLLRKGRVLVIYPEGELRPSGIPGPLADGAAWYARRAGVPLTAVAVRVVLRGQQTPEAYVSMNLVESDTVRLADTLRDDLSSVDCLVSAADPRAPLPGFRPVVSGRPSWDERIDSLARRLPWHS
jgi:hypothetical protein